MKSPFKSTLFSKIFLVITSVVFTLLISEGIFRLLSYSGIVKWEDPKFVSILHKYSDNEWLIYDLKPSFKVVSHGISFSTNSHGQRDVEYSMKKPPNTFRVAVIGDSVGFGWRIPQETVFTEVSEKTLNSEFAGKPKVEIINFSVIGYNSEQELIVLREKVLNYSPDMVVYAFCYNDDSFLDGYAELSRQSSPYSLGSAINSKLVSWVLDRLENANKRSWSSWDQVEKLFHALKEGSLKHSFKAVVFIAPRQNFRSTRDKKKKLKILAKETRLQTEFFLEEFLRESKNEDMRSLFVEHESHLSPSGMQIFADRLTNIAREHVNSWQRQNVISSSGSATEKF